MGEAAPSLRKGLCLEGAGGVLPKQLQPRGPGQVPWKRQHSPESPECSENADDDDSSTTANIPCARHM